MDIVVERKKNKIDKRYLLGLLIIPVYFLIHFLWTLGQSDFTVAMESIVTSDVKQGPFAVSVRGSGLLVPDRVHFLSADVEATVARVIVKAGKKVNKGDLIVELINPQLVKELAEAKSELEAHEAEAKADKVAQELLLLEQKATVANAKMMYEASVLKKKALTKLIETDAISRLDYDRTILETDQLNERWQISLEQYTSMQKNVIAQDNARLARLNKTKEMFERVQQQVDNLQVKATMDSIVMEMPLKAGQRVAMGANISKLVEQDSLIAELQIPEIQIRDVAVGQKVMIDTRNSKFEGSVSRIDPAVINGRVQVDVVFSEPLPGDARPDLSVDGEIKITELPDALYVDRPLFAQSSANTSFYKVDSSGDLAQRVSVKTGYGSVNQIQILEGLKQGDRIITSDSTRFSSYDKFRIN